MALQSFSEIAQQLQDAYLAIVSGRVASYTVGNDTYNRLSLADLERAMLRFRTLASRSTVGMTTLADMRDREIS